MPAIIKASDYRKSKLKEQSAKTPILNPKYDYVRVKEYAALVKQNPITIYENLKKGRIEGAVKSGRTWLIPVHKQEQ